MNVITIYSAMPNYDLGLRNAMATTYKVFEELNINNEEVSLYDMFLQYYNGETSPDVESLVNKIDKADGVVFAYTSAMNSPSALMQTFLEHLQHIPNKQFLYDKNCLLITVTNKEDPKLSLRYISDIINNFKGFDTVKIGLTFEMIKSIGYETEEKDMFEKQIEDYYRILRQDRKYFLFKKAGKPFPKPQFDLEDDFSGFSKKAQPDSEFYNEVIKSKDSDITKTQDIPLIDIANPFKDTFNHEAIDEETPTKKDIIVNKAMADQIELTMNEIDNNQQTFSTKAQTKPREFAKDISAEEMSQQLNLDSLSKKQEKDVKEISNFFATKFKPGKGGVIIEEDEKFYFDNITEETEITPRSRTTNQMTQILPHYYKASTSESMEFILQLEIQGEESFNGYIVVDNSTCEYIEEKHESPDIVVMADEKVWRDIITGKITAQKSFMTGLLKVKGNFILLTKFDQIFDDVL